MKLLDILQRSGPDVYWNFRKCLQIKIPHLVEALDRKEVEYEDLVKYQMNAAKPGQRARVNRPISTRTREWVTDLLLKHAGMSTEMRNQIEKEQEERIKEIRKEHAQRNNEIRNGYEKRLDEMTKENEQIIKTIRKEHEEQMEHAKQQDPEQQVLTDKIESLTKENESYKEKIQNLETQLHKALSELTTARDDLNATREEVLRLTTTTPLATPSSAFCLDEDDPDCGVSKQVKEFVATNVKEAVKEEVGKMKEEMGTITQNLNSLREDIRSTQQKSKICALM